MKLFKRKQFANKDFTEDMLPHNRREVFFDVIKLHWKSFIVYGLLMLALMLPLHMISIAETVTVSSIVGDANEITDDMMGKVLALKNIMAVLRIPCFLIVGLGLSGLVRVIRQYAWEENVDFKTDLFKGIKSNALQMLPLALVGGILYAVSVYAYNMSAVNENTFMSVMLMLPVGISVLFGIPVLAYATVAIPVYNNKFAKQLHIGLAMYTANPLKTLLTLFCLLLPTALLLIPNLTVVLIVRLVISILTPMLILAWMLFAFEQFDKHINAKHYPDLVGRGVYDPDKACQEI